jgi:hypothetical protein
VRLRLSPILAIVVLLGCRDRWLMDPRRVPELPGMTAYSPPAAPTLAHWRDMEACAGATRDPRVVAWFTVDAPAFAVPGASGTFRGYWFSARDHIVLALPSVSDTKLLRHEMLHAILRDGTHPPTFDRCGVAY